MNASVAAVDLGGTKIACALASETGKILVDTTIPTSCEEGPHAILNRIADVIDRLSREIGQSPRALGMGVPGVADCEAGKTLLLPNMPTQWRNVSVAEILGDHLGCAVYLLNDGRCAALGEATTGLGKDVNDMVFFGLGTGVGGGIVIDRKLRLGYLGMAGELGHMMIVPDGPLCICGNRGCLEVFASGTAIQAEGVRLMASNLAPALHDMTAGDPARVTPREMLKASECGDTAVTDSLRRAARYLGIGVTNIVMTIQPQLIVLGGGVAALGDLLIETVRTTVREHMQLFPMECLRIERSALGSQAGVYGAIALALGGGVPDESAYMAC